MLLRPLPPLRPDDLRHVRHQRARLPDLLRDAGRRSGGTHRRPQRLARDPRGRAQELRLRSADLPVQYCVMMKKLFITHDLTSFVNRGWKVVPAVLDTVPVTLSLVIGAALLWVIVRAARRPRRRGDARQAGRQAADGPRPHRHRHAGLLAGRSHEPLSARAAFTTPGCSPGCRRSAISRSARIPRAGFSPSSSRGSRWRSSISASMAGCCGPISSKRCRKTIIRTARAKGLSETRVMLRHALRTSLISFVTLFGLDFGALVGGSAPC